MHFGWNFEETFNWLQNENTKQKKNDEVEMSRDAEGDTSKMDQY